MSNLLEQNLETYRPMYGYRWVNCSWQKIMYEIIEWSQKDTATL